jgi:hypothetical protein
MTLQFEFKKDWQSGAVSFKKGQNVTGDVIEAKNKAPYTITNPNYFVEIKDAKGTARVPFCFTGLSTEVIIEPTVAPWLCNIGTIDLTPAPKIVNGVPVALEEGKTGLLENIFSLRNIIIVLIIIILIGVIIKLKNKKK